MGTKHSFTPGPWVAVQDGDISEEFNLPDGWVVRQVGSETRPWFICGLGTDPDAEQGPELLEVAANARLIAAAPELLAAAEAALVRLLEWSDFTHEIAQLEGAIAKATGEAV